MRYDHCLIHVVVSIVSKTPDHLLEDGDDVFCLRINDAQPSNMVMTTLMLLIGYGLKVLGRINVDTDFYKWAN